jgi:hypothetical protein
MKRIDQVCGIFWFVLGGVIAFESIHLDLGSLSHPGAGFMCFITGSLLSIWGIVLFTKSFHAGKAMDAAGEPIISVNTKKVGIVTLSLIIYGILLSSIGYIICTFLLLSILFNIYYSKRWLLRLIGAALLTCFTFIAFGRWLDCPLPKGIFILRF